MGCGGILSPSHGVPTQVSQRGKMPVGGFLQPPTLTLNTLAEREQVRECSRFPWARLALNFQLLFSVGGPRPAWLLHTGPSSVAASQNPWRDSRPQRKPLPLPLPSITVATATASVKMQLQQTATSHLSLTIRTCN